MPVSGEKQSGFIARQSTNCSAGVPIKKRRFPFIPSESPPPQEQSSLYGKHGLSPPSQEQSILGVKHDLSPPPQEQSSIDVKHDLSPRLNASALSSSGGPNLNPISVSKVKNENATSVNVELSGVDVFEVASKDESVAIHSDTYEVEREEKHVQTVKSLCSTDIVTNNVSSSNNMEGRCIKQQGNITCALEVSANLDHTNVSLAACNKPFVPALGHQNIDSLQSGSNLESSLLSLSLSSGKFTVESKNDDRVVDSVDAHVCASRSNWDLNMTMDAWKGSDLNASHQETIDRLNEASCTSVSKFSEKLSVRRVLRVGETPRLPPCPNYQSEDLHLSLSMPLHNSVLNEEQSGSSGKIKLGRVISDSDHRSVLGSSTNKDADHPINIKLEPVDGNGKHHYADARSRCHLSGSSDARNVKKEVIESSEQGAVRDSNVSPPISVDCRPLKSELVQDYHTEVPKRSDISSVQSLGPVELHQESCCSSTYVTSTVSFKSSSSGLLTSSESPTKGNVSNHSKHPEGIGHVDHPTITSPARENKDSDISFHMTNTRDETDFDGEKCDGCSSQSMDKSTSNTHANEDGSQSDEEKVNISADLGEEYSYDLDYDSDGSHAALTATDKGARQCVKEDDEYEDGEVREPLPHAEQGEPSIEGSAKGNTKCNNCDTGSLNDHLPNDSENFISPSDEKDSEMDDHMETNNDHIKSGTNDYNTKEGVEGTRDLVTNISSEEPIVVEVLASESDEKKVILASQMKQHHMMGEKDVQESFEKEALSDGSNGAVTTVTQATEVNIRSTDIIDKIESVILRAEESSNGKDAIKDVNGSRPSGNKSRIINLPRASNLLSPSRTRTIGGRSFSSQTGRERYNDYEGEKLCLRVNRDEVYLDVPQKFGRGRTEDHSFRNNRMIMRGRGRDSSHLETMRGEWNSNRDLALEICNDPVDYRFSRHRRATDVAELELEYNDYVMEQDDRVANAGRGGRKTLNDNPRPFRQMSSRRLSPRSRDGPVARGTQMVRRITRNISPTDGIAEDGSDLVGIRHGEKFMRGLTDDGTDSIFSHAQGYERLDGQFMRGNRDFSSGQRRGVPRILSKSPVRSQSHSPRPWLSPRRRSPNGFNGLSELIQHRSPIINRMGRLRSPDRLCFPEEIVGRRRDTPPYMGRQPSDMRDMGAAGDHGRHPRSGIHRRKSPSERILSRNTRRFDGLDPHGRTGSDEYFERPARSGRFNELRNNDSIDDRRRNSGEGRGVFRPFRPPYRGSDGQNIRFHLDDGPKAVRFCLEADQEFIERGNLRDRELDRRIKSRPVISHRRLRNIGEQEVNFRHNVQMWHDDGLDDDGSRVKRRRF